MHALRLNDEQILLRGVLLHHPVVLLLERLSEKIPVAFARADKVRQTRCAANCNGTLHSHNNGAVRCCVVQDTKDLLFKSKPHVCLLLRLVD
jgi:hypothetical protein